MEHPPEERRTVAPSAHAVALGVDHVRLSYVYLDRRDTEGYASLVDPGSDPLSAGAVPRTRSDRVPPPPSAGGHHELHRVISGNDSVAVVGTYVRNDGGRRDFVDVFTISEHGLLLTRKRFQPVEQQLL
ncbi:hypothetical protein [Nocardiopsis halotolerans]|uniref:hypothetical protein n=1 Tax=Nocardiopsis halotolerans TaxID=124252 RepID=UPI000344E4A1|nr:hypothetical protein [Nocardiopsis halotolerans]